jgi:hypothetical protein
MIGPFHRLLPNEIVKRKDLPLDGTCLRDKTNKTRICACSGLVLHNINDYLLICEQMIKCYY